MDFAHLHNKFFKAYKKRYALLIPLWTETRRSQDDASLAEFKFQIHSLKGEAGALGFDALYTIVKNIDHQVHAIQTSGLSQEAIDQVDTQLGKLIAAEAQTQNPLLIHPNTLNPQSGAEVATLKQVPEMTSDIKVAVIDNDKSGALTTVDLLCSFSFDAHYFNSFVACKDALESHAFDLLLLDVVMPDATEAEIFGFAEQCLAKGIRVICLSSKDDLSTRLQAVRCGVDDYAMKPLNINSLISKIRRIFNLDLLRPFKIVLLDDQPFIGQYFEKIASQKGFELAAYSSASDFIFDLDVTIPDIFLLDINMPDVSGIEVAKVLRHDARFEYVPIVFLSGDTSLTTKLQILSAGGEDVISKNDSPEHIFEQIEYRITRGQHVRSMAIKDGLTGLLNHAQLMDAVANCTRMANRMHSTYAIAMLDLDDFKQVNDTYGHSIGDNVIVGLAQVIARFIRRSDITGRYGGEEFMIAFQDVTDNEAIVKKLNELRNAFASILFEAENITFKSSFSCGVVFSGQHKTMTSLIKEADKALYQAKAKGKNRVVEYQPLSK